MNNYYLRIFIITLCLWDNTAVQQGEIIIPAKLKEGKVQTITFGRIPNQRKRKKALQLHATSDAGIPVQYYVLEGPAEMNGDLLKFTPIPPKAKFPVKVTVVDWQYGQSTEPKVQTAEPVIRSFYIEWDHNLRHPVTNYNDPDVSIEYFPTLLLR